MTSGWSDLFRLLSLAASRDKTRASRTYDLLSTRYRFGDNSLYLNLGYWEKATTYDLACEALADQLGLFAGLSSGQHILDVGYGFGDQDVFWAERFGVSILGLNITSSQVAMARERVADRGLTDRVDLREGSATAMPLADSTFDRVLALECAFHFETRADFFAEAFRVLRPGGAIALTDILKRHEGPLRRRHRALLGAVTSAFQVPPANFYTWREYRHRMQQAGFVNIRARSIREQVMDPFCRYLEARLGDRKAMAGMNPVVRSVARFCLRRQGYFEPFDYLLIAGDKPGP